MNEDRSQTWRALLERTPAYAGEVPAPSDLERRAADARARHQQRLEAVGAVSTAERALREELDGAAADRPEPQSPNLAERLRQALGLGAPAPAQPMIDRLWGRHERALTQVRLLGHHLDTLDRELASLDEELATLNRDTVRYSADAERAAAEVAVLEPVALQARAHADTRALRASGAPKTHAAAALADQLDAMCWKRKTEHQRYEAAEAGAAGLAAVARDLRGVLRELVERLSRLHGAGLDVLAQLDGRLNTLARAAAARQLSTDALDALADLRHTLLTVSNLADTHAAYLDDHVDEMASRMEALDLDSAARRAAAEEVEAALARAEGRIGRRRA